MSDSLYIESDAAKAASDYFNSLPQEDRARLAPLLEHYRQMGLAEAHGYVLHAVVRTGQRIRSIRDPQPDLMAALEASLSSPSSDLTKEG